MHKRQLTRAAVEAMQAELLRSPEVARVGILVSTQWMGGARGESRVQSTRDDGEWFTPPVTVASDAPAALLGSGNAANPHELLLAGLNGCLLATFAMHCAAAGLTLESLEIETTGRLDLRGAFGLAPDIKPGYETLNYTVRVRGSGTPAEFRAIHQAITASSPGFFNLANPIQIQARLEVK